MSHVKKNADFDYIIILTVKRQFSFTKNIKRAEHIETKENQYALPIFYKKTYRITRAYHKKY